MTGLLVLTLKGHASEIRGVALSPDGKWIVSGSGDKTVKVWEISSLDTSKQPPPRPPARCGSDVFPTPPHQPLNWWCLGYAYGRGRT